MFSYPVVARPEVVVQGLFSAADLEAWRLANPQRTSPAAPQGSLSWVELPFLYKPGDVNRRPLLVAPHQPRLDWQMWFAALGSYQVRRLGGGTRSSALPPPPLIPPLFPSPLHPSLPSPPLPSLAPKGAPWLIHLMHKLVSYEPDDPALAPLRSLLDVHGSVFESRRPIQVRARLYHYDFTSSELKGRTAFGDERGAQQQVEAGSWWRRVLVQESFVPSFGANDTSVLTFLQHHGWSAPPAGGVEAVPCSAREALAQAVWDSSTPKRVRQRRWWQPARLVATKLARPLCLLARAAVAQIV